MKIKRKNKNSPITNKTIVDGQAFFTFQGVKYAVDKYVDFMQITSDQLNSVVFRQKEGLYVITTLSDFGGLGNHAIKPHIIPFASWLTQYCKIIENN